MSSNNNEFPGRGANGEIPCVFPICQRQKVDLRNEIQTPTDRINDAVRVLATKEEEIARWKATETRLEKEKEKLLKEIKRLKSRAGLHTKKTWRGMMNRYLGIGDGNVDEDGDENEGDGDEGNGNGNRVVRWEDVVRQCCREENMSTRVEVGHPDIKFVGVREQEEEGMKVEGDKTETGRETGSETESSEEEDTDEDSLFVEQDGSALARVLGVEDEDDDDDVDMKTPEPDEPVIPTEHFFTGPFNFEGLPWEVQQKILKLVLHKEGELVHCISRLDPFVPPERCPAQAQEQEQAQAQAATPPAEGEPEGAQQNQQEDEEAQTAYGLINGFFWGKKTCQITSDVRDPNEVLSLLLVSRRFHFVGVHIFYGLNTFAFSSFGEFYRFCKGSGLARVARIQHVELCFVGNQYLTQAVLPRKTNVPFSRRTSALWSFMDMYRLKTLVIHINESAKGYIRRKYETKNLKEWVSRKTAGQPNYRLTRSMRTCQGMDYLYQLRGMDWIHFYDLNFPQVEGGRTRAEIRDWSFLKDINSGATMPKVPSRAEGARLEKLRPLLEPRRGAGNDDGHQDDARNDWKPSEDDWTLVKNVYSADNGWCSYDELSARGYKHDMDIPSRIGTYSGSTRASSGSSGGSSSSGSSSSGSSSSPSSSSGPSGSYLTSGGSPPRRRNGVRHSISNSSSSSESSSHPNSAGDDDSSDSDDSDVVITGVTINLIDEEADTQAERQRREVESVLADVNSRSASSAMPPPPPTARSISGPSVLSTAVSRFSHDSLFVSPAPGLDSARPTPITSVTPAPVPVKDERTSPIISRADELIDLTGETVAVHVKEEDEEPVIVWPDEVIDLTENQEDEDGDVQMDEDAVEDTQTQTQTQVDANADESKAGAEDTPWTPPPHGDDDTPASPSKRARGASEEMEAEGVASPGKRARVDE